MNSKQTSSCIMMIRPANFGFNQETAESNAFQSSITALTTQQIKQKAQAEFDSFVNKLRGKGVEVIVVEDTDEPIRPDAVFPNNWITFHHNGTIITYPMYAPNRRNERREDVVEMMKDKFDVKRIVRFEDYEDSNQFLEGTGSMILDRPNRLVYACLSPRTDGKLLDEFCQWANYKKVEFHSVDSDGKDIYHTNVMMALGDSFAVICLESIKDNHERKNVIQQLQDTQKEIIDISFQQVLAFAGNMLQVQSTSGNTYLVMSQQAFDSLNEHQVQQIEKHTEILSVDISTIEKFGGGSARCMMAEVFLPLKNQE